MARSRNERKKATPSQNGRKKNGHVPISANGAPNPELGQVSISNEIVHIHIEAISPSPRNDLLYKPIDTESPAFKAFVEEVRINGITDPLILSEDFEIGSGHRRYAAARVLKIPKLPCRIAQIHSSDPRFIRFLRTCNQQRVKTLDEVLREEVVAADPEEAHRALTEERQRMAEVNVDTIVLGEYKRRTPITDAKRPFLNAIIKIIEVHRHIWPLSVRQIHYFLLNDPPLMHASKPRSRYWNDQACYKSCDELTVRARLAGLIPIEAIHDPTRPVVTWSVHSEPTPFIRKQLDRFLKGYYRNLMQSQPNHIEIIGEKNTIEGILRSVAWEYTIPYTIGRGYSSLPPRNDLAKRFRSSGKEKLILLVLSDFDPEGEDIGRAFAQSMRDDFGVTDVVPIKVALTAEQVSDLNLPPNRVTRKKNGSRKKAFVRKHGEAAYELEAIPPETLQEYLSDAIDNVIDVDLFNEEIEREKHDAAFLDTVRLRAHEMLGNLGAS